MKAERKKELKGDELADGLLRFLRRAKPYLRYVIAVLIVAGIIMFWQSVRHKKEEVAKGQEAIAFLQAIGESDPSVLEDFIERYPEAKERPRAMFILANRYFQAAVIALGEIDNRPMADEQLEKAEKLYCKIAENYSSYAPLADYARAMVAAQRGELESAREQLSALSAAYRGKFVGDMALEQKGRLATLQTIKFAPEEEAKNEDEKPAQEKSQDSDSEEKGEGEKSP